MEGEILENVDWEALAMQCSSNCSFAVGPEVCVECVANNTEVSYDCAGCVSHFVSCARNYCREACETAESDTCSACLEANCWTWIDGCVGP